MRYCRPACRASPPSSGTPFAMATRATTPLRDVDSAASVSSPGVASNVSPLRLHHRYESAHSGDGDDWRADGTRGRARAGWLALPLLSRTARLDGGRPRDVAAL